MVNRRLHPQNGYGYRRIHVPNHLGLRNHREHRAQLRRQGAFELGHTGDIYANLKQKPRARSRYPPCLSSTGTIPDTSASENEPEKDRPLSPLARHNVGTFVKSVVSSARSQVDMQRPFGDAHRPLRALLEDVSWAVEAEVMAATPALAIQPQHLDGHSTVNYSRLLLVVPA